MYLRGALRSEQPGLSNALSAKLHAVIPAVALPHCGPGERRRLVADYDSSAPERRSLQE